MRRPLSDHDLRDIRLDGAGDGRGALEECIIVHGGSSALQVKPIGSKRPAIEGRFMAWICDNFAASRLIGIT